MTEQRALTVRPSITPSIWQMVREIAPSMHQSRLFGVLSAEQAAAIMLKGHELGLPLTAAFEFIHVIGGKPGLSPRGALAIIHQHPELIEFKIKRSDAQACTVWMKRKDTGFEFERTFTMDEAKQAQLLKADSGYDKWPINMLMWRCVGFVADVVCPDLIGGLKRADELGAAITPDGDVIEGTWQTASAAAPTLPPGPTIDDLLQEGYTPEQIIRAGAGTMPTTQQAITEVASILRARTRAGLEAPGDSNPDDPEGLQELAAENTERQ